MLALLQVIRVLTFFPDFGILHKGTKQLELKQKQDGSIFIGRQHLLQLLGHESFVAVEQDAEQGRTHLQL